MNSPDKHELLAVYRAMYTARQIDHCEQQVTNRGEAFFHVSGSGHEATAALAPLLKPDDWLHCHYRDKALLVARGLPLKQFFDNLYCKRESSSAGRRMSAFFSDPELHVLSMVTPTGNNALQSVGVAQAVKPRANRPIVMCAVGDGTTQQGEFLEGIAEAARGELPVLFVIEDNHWAISTPTAGRTFYSPASSLESAANSPRPTEFHGVPIHFVDGRDPVHTLAAYREIVTRMRDDRRPAIVVLEVDRLTTIRIPTIKPVSPRRGHLASRGRERQSKTCARTLLELDVSETELAELEAACRTEVAAAEEASAHGAEPITSHTAKRPLHVELTHPARERRGEPGQSSLTMRDALRNVLKHHLATDDRVSLLGEDIEDPKGDVFGVTRGLSTEFPGRVVNSPLTESTIMGVSIGRSLAGERPVAFLQFADFMPLAFNQIASELATMYWRTDGSWETPVIVMMACGGYRPGLGPYHAQTYEGTLAHIPGIDIFMPSTAADAAGMLNAAFRSRRPTFFLYPKALLNDPQLATSANVAEQFVPIGPARKVRGGRDITLVGWATRSNCARRRPRRLGSRCRSRNSRPPVLSRLGTRAFRAGFGRENSSVAGRPRRPSTCGLGGEILATVAEKTRVPVAMRRVTRPDTHIPCNYVNHVEVLPSFRRVLATAAELLNLDLVWREPPAPQDGLSVIEAIGSGPADESVVVAELFGEAEGDTIARGDVVAALEATKSVFELTSQLSGEVVETLANEGDSVAVGAPLFKVRSAQANRRPKPISQEQHGTPVLTRRKCEATYHLPVRYAEPRAFEVGISHVSTAFGGRCVTNNELLAGRPGHTDADIQRRTGIASRYWVGEHETAVSLAAQACWKALDHEQMIVDDLDLVICATTSPTVVTPSMACRILNELSGGKSTAMMQAYDINAACSGYLYALQAGYDYLQSTPNGRVLIVTAEVLSPLLNLDDFDTAILFGDASSATILYGEEHLDRSRARLRRPDLSAKGEDGSTLSVPFLHGGFIQMKGRKVFTEAVRTMVASLNRTCQRQGVSLEELRMVVPHQANQRIIDAIQARVPVDVYSNIRHFGNTSSSSIPLCLSEVLPTLKTGERVGLCAFGGGFTFGAGILQSN
ncbi:MAG: beta-ketoacyl-ACP synthase 3 [Pirellulaceae bacterium]